MNRKLICLVFLAAFILAPLALVAEDSERKGKGERGERGERGGQQLQVMIDACADIAEGDACTFIGRNDEEATGTCAVARNETLLCQVEGQERGGRGGMGMGGMGGNRGGDAADDVQS